MTIEHINYDNFSKEILVRRFNGKVDLAEIMASWDYLVKSSIITTEHKGVINDLECADLSLDQDSFQKLMNYLKTQPLLKKLRLAVVCDNPKNIVFPILAESDERELSVKTFSTFEAAVNWVNS